MRYEKIYHWLANVKCVPLRKRVDQSFIGGAHTQPYVRKFVLMTLFYDTYIESNHN